VIATVLVLMLVITGVIAFFAAPRGTVTGRSALLTGQALTLAKTSILPVLHFVPETTVTWQGRTWVFALVQLPSRVCRAYIVEHPSYLGRASTLHDTHRLRDRFGRAYVCWTPEPTGPDGLASVLALWVAASTRYLDTGVFPAASAAGNELNRPSGGSPRSARG
jgi:hypothetical protein